MVIIDVISIQENRKKEALLVLLLLLSREEKRRTRHIASPKQASYPRHQPGMTCSSSE